MRILYCAVLLAAAVLGGCVSSVTSKAFHPKSPNYGVVYSLPMTRLKVNLTYTIQKETRVSNGIAVSRTETVVLGKPVTLETILAPDEANSFVLSGDGLAKDSRLDLSFKFAVGDNKLLTSVTSDITDKTPEVLEGLVGSGISIAKMVAVAGKEELPAPLKRVHTRLDVINEEIASLAAQADPKKLEKIDALVKEQQALLTFVMKYQELNAPKTEERDVLYSAVLDLSDFAWNGAAWTKVVRAPGKKLGANINDPDVPGATIQVIGTADQYANSITPHKVPEGGENGIFYRAPVFLRTKIMISPHNILVFDDYVPFAQAGPINKVEARYKVFAKRKTTITFASTTGSVKEYGVEAGSSVEGLAKSLDSSLSKTQTALAEIRKAQAAARKSPEEAKLADLEMQKKLADAEANLIRAQQELDKLKAGPGSE